MKKCFRNIRCSGQIASCALLGLCFLLLFANGVNAQTYVPTGTMTGTPAAGSYYNSGGITLTNFSFTASSGNSLRIFVSPCVPLSVSLSSTQNYISTVVPRIAGFTTSSSLSSLTTCQAMQTVQYIDGLGRPMQTVQVKGNPDGSKDVIMAQAYDAFGREATKYLPYTTASGNPGSYRSDALNGTSGYSNSGQKTFYGTSGQNYKDMATPFAITGFEPSPLNRVVQQGAPGDAWQLGQHTSGVAYTSNDANTINFSTGAGYPAKRYTVSIDANGTRSLSDGGSYATSQLYVSITHDENYSGSGKAGTVEEYKDKEGHVVLKRTFNHNNTSGQDEALSTYYVYDDLGQLAFVLPPLADPDNGLSSAASQTTLNNLCYQYNYDERNRLVQKRLPGKDWEYIVYNQLDQLVLTQDGKQRGSNQWTVTKYDALGRTIITGLWNAGSAIAQSTLQASIYSAAQFDAKDNTANTSSYPTGYVIGSYPQTLSSTLMISYYDDYNIPNLPAAYTATSYSAMTRGLTTASRTAVLNADGSISSDMLWMVHYYDDEGRNVKTYQQHYLGGAFNTQNFDELATSYNFDNGVASTTRQHHTAAADGAISLTIANSYVYDHMGRKTETHEKINNGPDVTLSKNTFNEVGQLYTKSLHSASGGSFLQNVTYTYNERGWLKTSSAPLFATQLNYDDGSTPQWNGNIADQYWGTPGSLGKNYTYQYDALNRLTQGNSNTGYAETGISYDKAGNLLSLNRSGGANAATLSYDGYSGNQLTSIKNGTTQFRSYGTYDANGNAPSDGQGHGIDYNLFNLPRNIGGLNLSYTYDATGKKLRKISNGTVTEYISGIQYTGSVIDFVATEEGRVLNPTSSPNYEYTLTDHLGNSRVSFDSSHGGTAPTQVNDYYPFGLVASQPTTTSPPNKYLYNNKELQDGLNQYDYGARFYDPVIGRWTSVDPLAEEGKRWSPYAYCYDDPLGKIDIDGMIPWPLKGYAIVNKKDVTNGGWNLKNTLVRTSTFLEIRNIGTSPHVGIDYRASIGTPFYSLGNGVVSSIGAIKRGGAKGAKFIEIKYGNGDKIRFLHLSYINKDLKEGTPVYEGQELGKTGDTGAKFAHLHVDGKNKKGEMINPENRNYGTLTNEQFFVDYGGDYKSLPGYIDNGFKEFVPADPTELFLFQLEKTRQKMKDDSAQFEKMMKDILVPKLKP
ncbi:peptidoglycan DD-metalloendopeptidase family protein [Mucilaginibacter mali]|uniref:Peptidoglycan DD-metalloendopeptidase family protein n=1 Tax=Mucilaginibacter mali TaxID=2740462 RepID=A0A7D4TWV4_9SPHI|nr:DUF6443 domain-containing protein [Mucilaginibacter mali]QKJ31795.1 peptidoglycan DD-metalloendopeptidase family protein [Mucilaginibacter mali]